MKRRKRYLIHCVIYDEDRVQTRKVIDTRKPLKTSSQVRKLEKYLSEGIKRDVFILNITEL